MIGRLKLEEFIDQNNKIESISEDSPIEKAKSKMILQDYSQLAVTTNNKGLKAVSWKSIGKAELLDGNVSRVKDCLEDPVILEEDKSFIKYLKLIAKKDYVFVQDSKGKLSGIITTYDMTMRFNSFLKPYIEIGLIEEALRNIIRNNLGKEEVILSRNGREASEEAKEVTKLTFSEYTMVLGNRENWDIAAFNDLDRNIFINHLNSIRPLRNKIAHYSPNPLTESEKYKLKVTRELLLNMID